MPYIRHLPSGRWQAVYRDVTGRRHTGTFDRADDAEAWARAQETDVLRGVHRDPHAGRERVGDWYARWRLARVAEKNTLATDDSHWKNHVKLVWEEWPLDSITRMEVQGWVRRMQTAGAGPRTVKAAHRLLSSLLESALSDGLIARNPARGVDLPTVPRRAERFLSEIEHESLLGVLDEPWRTLVLTAPYTGLRWGELVGIDVTALDLLRKQLRVVQVVTEINGRFTVKPYPKSSKSFRVVPLTARVKDALAAHLVGHPGGLVFTMRSGRPVSRHGFRQNVWLPAVEAAKVAKPWPRVHDLRHTYGSWLVQRGVDIRTVQTYMGHESVTTTERYTHLAPTASEQVRTALEGQAK